MASDGYLGGVHPPELGDVGLSLVIFPLEFIEPLLEGGIVGAVVIIHICLVQSLVYLAGLV